MAKSPIWIACSSQVGGAQVVCRAVSGSGVGFSMAVCIDADFAGGQHNDRDDQGSQTQGMDANSGHAGTAIRGDSGLVQSLGKPAAAPQHIRLRLPASGASLAAPTTGVAKSAASDAPSDPQPIDGDQHATQRRQRHDKAYGQARLKRVKVGLGRVVLQGPIQFASQVFQS